MKVHLFFAYTVRRVYDLHPYGFGLDTTQTMRTNGTSLRSSREQTEEQRP